ncbi:conserved Plasmodium protein, unknown function [Plasmodium gallinaceum]|uniref:Uncharacterized protein n=1 Tax=Plasmodium gallinaceum TaxID=5849 RepID=A0A1J1GXU4_PLAGA|nr:conserved Plasmodium protein, unknown function [Plasmodium gallinaceum]CRG97277.1 conserved Plasmodium protein, unknown function [Plasmodium gallinaceum]
MELVIKEPYIVIFEKILKLFTSICENLHFRLTQNKLQLSGSNSLTNELIIYIDKKFFLLNEINSDIRNINGTVNSKDFYNCIYSHKIVKQFKNNGYYSCNKNNNEIKLAKNYDKEDKYQGKNKKCNLNISKLILKFNKEKINILEIVIKFKKCNTHFSAILKLRSFNTPLKNYMYKNESIIQVEPTLFLLNLKDLANERNIFLKNTDNSFVISSLETSEFSLNKEKVKREQFFYNNKFIAIPSCKTKYFFKNKKFEDHNMSLPLNELKNIIKFCSDLNLLCLFSTKNFKENLIIYFGSIITHILEKNRKRITNIRKKRIYDDKYYYKDNYSEGSPLINFKEEHSNSCVFYLSDDNSSDEFDSSLEDIDKDGYFLDHYETNSLDDRHFNDIITGYMHFTSYFNISCNFKELQCNDSKVPNDFQQINFNQHNNSFEKKENMTIKQDKKLKKGFHQESFFRSDLSKSNMGTLNNSSNKKNELFNEVNKKFNINENSNGQNLKKDNISDITNMKKNYLNEPYDDYSYNLKFLKNNKNDTLGKKELNTLDQNNNRNGEWNCDNFMKNSKNKEFFYDKNIIDNGDIYKMIRNNNDNKYEKYNSNKDFSDINNNKYEKYNSNKDISNINNNKYEKYNSNKDISDINNNKYEKYNSNKDISNINNNKYEICYKNNNISNTNDNVYEKYDYNKYMNNNNNNNKCEKDDYNKYINNNNNNNKCEKNDFNKYLNNNNNNNNNNEEYAYNNDMNKNNYNNNKYEKCYNNKNINNANDNIYEKYKYDKNISNNSNNKYEKYDYDNDMKNNNNNNKSEKDDYNIYMNNNINSNKYDKFYDNKDISNSNFNIYEKHKYDKNLGNNSNNEYEKYNHNKNISNSNENLYEKHKYDKNLGNYSNNEYEKYDFDKINGDIKFEELNYDKFIRGNTNISDAYMNIKVKIKELDSTLENLKNIDNYKKNCVLNKKLNNYVGISSDYNASKNINKRKNFVDNFQIRKRNKKISNDSYKDLKIKRNNSHESISEYNSMVSDSFYSLSEDNEIENNSKYENIEYFDYFNKLYSKYNIYNNMKKWEINSGENFVKQNLPLGNGDKTNGKLHLLNYNKNSKYRRLNTNNSNTVIKTNENNIHNLKHNNKQSYYTNCKFKNKK